MRQFVFGLLIAVLLAWGYSRFGRDAAAGGAGSPEAKVTAKVDLEAMVASPAGEAAADAASHASSQSTGNSAPGNAAPGNPALAAPPLSARASSDPLQQALDRLVARLQTS